MKRVEKDTKGVESTTTNILSKAQLDILDMLTKKFITVDKIAEQRGTSKAAVYKVMKKLRKKGLLTRGFTRGLKKSTGLTPEEGKIRLHGQQFKISILYKQPLYDKIREHRNIIVFEGNTINLHEKSIIVSCNELVHFYGETPDHAMAKSLQYWHKHFLSLQERLNVTLLLENKTKIVQFNAHYGEIGNELAKESSKKKQNIMIRGDNDGLVWLKADKSWDVDEIETIHPKQGKDDMQDIVQPFFNDIRDKEWIKLSEISKYMANTTYQVNEISHGLKAVVDYLQLTIPKKKELSVDQENLSEYIG